jgi:hypothetical protein
VYYYLVYYIGILEGMLSEIVWETKRFARDLSVDWWQRKQHSLGTAGMIDSKSFHTAHEAMRELERYIESVSDFLMNNTKYQKSKAESFMRKARDNRVDSNSVHESMSGSGGESQRSTTTWNGANPNPDPNPNPSLKP